MMSLFMMDMVVLERTTGMTRLRRLSMMPSSTKTPTTNLKEMREEAFRRVGRDNATIEGQITAAERFP